AGPKDTLLAVGEGAELVLREHGLAGADRELGDVSVAETGVPPRTEHRGRGDLRAVRGEECVEGGDGQDPCLVEERQDDLGSGETVAGGGGVQEPDIRGAVQVAAPLLARNRLSDRGPGEDLAEGLEVANPAAAWPGPGARGAGGQFYDLDGLTEVQGEPGAVGGDSHPGEVRCADLPRDSQPGEVGGA